MSQAIRPVVRISVFYTCERWTEILQYLDGVFRDAHSSYQLHSFLLLLSHERGDHIRLSLKLKPGGRNGWLVNFVESLGNFISINPSPQNNGVYPIKTFFMDFPNNSIQYNTFPDIIGKDQCSKSLQRILSRLVIEFFKNQQINFESRLTFLIYLQLGIVKSCTQSPGRSCDQLFNFIQEMFGNAPTSLSMKDQRLDVLYTQNEKFLKEIFLSKIEGYPSKNFRNFLVKWEQTIYKYDEGNLMSFKQYHSILTLIYLHTGVLEYKLLYYSLYLVFRACEA